MAQTPTRRKYQAGFKLNVIAYAKKHNNCAAAREYGVTEKVVRDWRLKEDILKKIPKSKCAMRRGSAHWPNLENYLADLVCEYRKNGYGISRNKIRNMALEWAKENQADCKDFKATASWCSRFMERHNLVLRKRTKLAKKLPTELDTEITYSRRSKLMQRKKSSNEYDKILETASELYTANQLPVKSQVIKSAHQQITPSYSLNKLDVEHRRKNPSSSASKSINSLSDANQSFSPPAKVPKKHNFSKPFISAGQTHVIDKPAAVSSSTTDTRSQPIDCSSSSSKNQSFSSKNIQKPQTAPKSEKQLQMSPTIDVSHQKEKRMLVVPNHQSSVMSNMSSLWKAGRLCDAYISNGTVSIMVHQIVFGAVCPKVLPVFYNAFHSDLPAVTFPSTVSEEALLAFCEYMYDGVLELDKNILSQLKIIAQCLDMQGFDQLCNNQLKIAENSVTVPTDMLESILTEPCSSSGLISDNATNTQITCQDNFTPVSQVIPSKLITLYNRNLEENSNVLSSKFPTEIKRKVVKQEISDTSNEQDDINSNHEDDLINKPQIKVELIGPDDHRYGYQDFLLAQQGSDISDADLTQSSLLSHNTSLDNFEQNSDIQQTEQSLLSSSSLSPHFSLHSESHPVGYITPTSIRRLVSCDKFQHLKNSENSKPYPVSLFSANYEPISLSSSNLQLVNVKKKHIAR